MGLGTVVCEKAGSIKNNFGPRGGEPQGHVRWVERRGFLGRLSVRKGALGRKACPFKLG